MTRYEDIDGDPNFIRRIFSFEIQNVGPGVYRSIIKGSAFLWHQVRMMMQMLFLIGKTAEEPEVIDLLLDTEKVPKKPNFELAPAENLLLSDCGFEDLTPEMWTHDYGAYEVFSHFRQQIELSRVKDCLLGSVCEYLQL